MYERLRKARQEARHDERGFTLIELLIVITVLGILAGIVVFGVATFRQDANTAAHDASCKTVSTAAEAYNAKNGNYPATVTDLVTAKYLKSAPPATANVGDAIDNSTGLAANCTS